jgi:hypothetical protein
VFKPVQNKSKFDISYYLPMFIALINQLLAIAKNEEKRGGGLEEGENYRLLE